MPMTLNEALLEKLASWKPPPGRASLGVSAEGSPWTATVVADETNPLSSLLWDLSLRRGKPDRAATETELKTWAERVSQRGMGLLENLHVVEVDAVRQQAQLRSDEPSQRGDEVFYYELLLSGTYEVLLRRYKAPRQGAGHREQIASPITHEALAKLVSTLIG
jgi:hypothetical protein